MDVHQEAVEEVRNTEARSKRAHRTAHISNECPSRRFGSPDERARNRMVVVPQPVPPREHPAAFDHRCLVQNTLEIGGVRRLTLHHPIYLPRCERLKGRQHLRPEPSPPASCSIDLILLHLVRRVDVRDD